MNTEILMVWKMISIKQLIIKEGTWRKVGDEVEINGRGRRERKIVYIGDQKPTQLLLLFGF